MLSIIKKVLLEIYQYRQLLFTLTLRELKVKYKQTVLGISWAIFVPLSMMVIFSFIFHRIARFSSGNIPYPLFAYCGLVPWTFFARALSSATGTLVSNAGLVTKIYFPREVIPLSTIISYFVDFLVASLLLVGLIIFYRIPFHVTIFLCPFVLIIQVILMVGLSFILSMGNLFFRDVGHIWGVVIFLWMFATSVIYPVENITSPILKTILLFNPMLPIIDGYRLLILEGELPSFEPLGISLGISLIIFLLGTSLFHKYEPLFAENI